MLLHDWQTKSFKDLTPVFSVNRSGGHDAPMRASFQRSRNFFSPFTFSFAMVLPNAGKPPTSLAP
jgi:hypothetical protein